MVKTLIKSNSRARLEISVEKFAGYCDLANKYSASKVTEWLDKLSNEDSLYALGALSKEYYDFFPVERDNLKATLFRVFSELQRALSEFECNFAQLVDVYLGLELPGYQSRFLCQKSAHKMRLAEQGSEKLPRLQRALRLVKLNHENDIKSFLEVRMANLVDLAIDSRNTEQAHNYLDTLKSRRDQIEGILFVVNLTLKLQAAVRYDASSARSSRETQLMSELLAAIDVRDFSLVERIARQLGVFSSKGSEPESSRGHTDSSEQPWWRSVDPNWWREQE